MSTIRYPITIELDREADGRWIAETPGSPGVLAYGPTAGAAVEACLGLLARVEGRSEDKNRAFLLSELRQINTMLASAPSSDVIGILSLESRKEKVIDELCAGPPVPDFLVFAAQVGPLPTSGMASADPLPDFCQDCGQHGPHLCPGHHPAATYDPSEEGK